jgi:hypothetical protein
MMMKAPMARVRDYFRATATIQTTADGLVHTTAAVLVPVERPVMNLVIGPSRPMMDCLTWTEHSGDLMKMAGSERLLRVGTTASGHDRRKTGCKTHRKATSIQRSRTEETCNNCNSSCNPRIRTHYQGQN